MHCGKKIGGTPAPDIRSVQNGSIVEIVIAAGRGYDNHLLPRSSGASDAQADQGGRKSTDRPTLHDFRSSPPPRKWIARQWKLVRKVTSDPKPSCDSE